MPSVLVNKVAYDFQSLETEIVAEGGSSFGIVTGIEEFDYTVTINRTEMYGAGRLPVDVTEGDAEFDASITIQRYWFHQLLLNAEALGVPLASLRFTMAFTYYAKDEDLVTDTLTTCMLKEIGNQGSHGPDTQMVSMPLRVGNIYFRGKDVFGNQL